MIFTKWQLSGKFNHHGHFKKEVILEENNDFEKMVILEIL